MILIAGTKSRLCFTYVPMSDCQPGARCNDAIKMASIRLAGTHFSASAAYMIVSKVPDAMMSSK